MKPADRKRIQAWITGRIFEEQADGAPLRCFKLSQIVEGNAGKKPCILEVQCRDQGSAEAITEELLGHAQMDADAAGGLQKYEIKAQYGVAEAETRGGRCAFRLTGETEDKDDDMGFSAMSTDARGMLAQQMRHNEGFAKATILMTTEIVALQNTLVNSLAVRVEKAEDRSAKMAELMERMMSDRMERELAARRELRQEKREEMIIDTIQKVVVPKVLEKYGAAETQIEYLISTMDDEQLGAMADKLRPDQIPLFIAVAQKLEAKKAAASNAQKEITQAQKEIVAAAETAASGTTIEDILVKEKGETK